MNRTLRSALLIGAVLGFPGAALADTTATYAIGKKALTVQIADNGDSRIEFGGKFSLITHGGQDYLVLAKDGESLVVRYADIVQIAQGAVNMDAPKAEDGTPEVFGVTPGAPAEVAGHKGSGWAFGPTEAGARKVEVVMSDEAELAPVGTLIRRLATPAVAMIDKAMPGSAQFGTNLNLLLAKGTPLRIAPFLELSAVDHKQIDAHRFDLPAPVLSMDDAKAKLGANKTDAPASDAPKQ